MECLLWRWGRGGSGRRAGRRGGRRRSRRGSPAPRRSRPARSSGARRRALRSRSPPPSLIRPGARPVMSSVTIALPADQLAVAERELGAAVEPLDHRRPHHGQHGDRRGSRGEDLHGDGQADDGGDHADQGTGREHDQDQVEAEHLGHAQHDRQTEPGLPGVLPRTSPWPDPIRWGGDGSGRSRRRSARASARREPAVLVAQQHRHPEGLRQVSAVTTSLERPGGDHPPRRAAAGRG